MNKKLASEIIYSDEWVKFYRDQVLFSNGKTGTYSWVDRKSGVAVAVINDKNQILLNHEFRYVTNSFSWEIPGGGIDAGETSEQAAIREVKEEAGLAVSQIQPLGNFYPLNSFNTELIAVFMARTESGIPHTTNNESSELIDQQKFIDLNEALQMVDQGEIVDLMTAMIIQMVARKLTD